MPDHTTETPVLPTLDPGVQELVVDDDASGALHALVVDHLLTNDGRAYWVDAGGHARTTTLCDVAPSDRLLDRVRIARAFTAPQHATLLETLRYRIDDPPALFVCPGFDRLYRDGELPAETNEAALVHGVAVLAGLAREHDVPVLVTRHRADETSAPVARAADRRIECRATPFGPRFVGDDVETLVYPQADGTYQTTIDYWCEVLAARVRQEAPTAATPEVTADGSH